MIATMIMAIIVKTFKKFFMSKVIHSKIDLMKIHITTLLLFYENDDAANYDDVGGGKVWAGQVLFPSNSDHRRV